MPDSARVVMERCDELATLSEEPEVLTRRFATPALRTAQERVAEWMRAAGMAVRRDNIGNLIGRYEGRTSGAKTLLLGSHLDTVRDAGRYDGPLGVLIALACVERLRARGERLPFALEIVAFADEEGLRYHSTYLGSSALAGSLDPATLSLTDADSVTLAEAIRAFGGDPTAIHDDRRRGDDLLGYCEVHIEQGPVLEAKGLPVGVVSAIAGQGRASVSFTGQAGHAGTVPPELRRDALCAAAEFVLAVEAVARARPGLVATVGQIAAQPGASNVIPGHVTLSLDLRHQHDVTRLEACAALRDEAARIGAARGVTPGWHAVQQHDAVACSPALMALLARSVAEQGYPVECLASGAGHDGVALAALTPIAMLFVRCKGGISHNPAESVAIEDISVALDTMQRFLTLLAEIHADGQ